MAQLVTTLKMIINIKGVFASLDVSKSKHDIIDGWCTARADGSYVDPQLTGVPGSESDAAIGLYGLHVPITSLSQISPILASLQTFLLGCPLGTTSKVQISSNAIVVADA